MRITYDKESDALAIDFRDAEYHESEEIYDGFVIDFDKSGRPMGIEIYCDASKFVDIPRLLQNMAEPPGSAGVSPALVRSRMPSIKRGRDALAALAATRR